MTILQSRAFKKLALLAFASCLVASPTLAQFKLLDTIVAVVDTDVVMNSELQRRMDNIYQRLAENGTEAPPPELLRPQVLERLIVERIQLNMALRAGVRISDTELNAAITRMAKAQGLTFEQLVESLHQSGMTLTEIKADIRNEMMLNQVQQSQVNRRIYISEQEINNFLASEEGKLWSSPDLNLGHILLSLPAGAGKDEVAATQKKAEDILARLAAGEDFKSLAVAYSAGQNALSGGDLGWRKAAQLPDIFTSAIADLEPGQVSQPIRSDAGIHLLKLYERRGSTKQLLQQKKVSHILLIPNEIRPDADTEAQIEALRQRIIDGEDFAAVAKASSEDISTALSGGDLGWSLPGKFVPEFEQVLNATDPGAISESFRSPFGWHILKVSEQREQDFSDEIRRNQAQNILRQRKFQEELQIWLQEIRDEAFVEIKA